jgi:hypothetical protein
VRVSSQHVLFRVIKRRQAERGALADFCGRFIPHRRHSRDMDEAKVRRLVEESSAAPSPGIPGAALDRVPANRGGMHILGMGALAITAQNNPAQIGRLRREHGGWAVLAHPRRLG